MVDEDGVLRRVAWSELFPWLILFRSFRLAIRFRTLMLAAMGILITLSGWALFGLLFHGQDLAVGAQMRGVGNCPWLGVTSLVPDQPAVVWPPSPFFDGTAAHEAEPIRDAKPRRSAFVRASEPLTGAWEHLSRPFREALGPGMTIGELAYRLLCGLWALAVWALFGVAITRTTAVELAAGERIGWEPMLRFAVRKWPACFAAPLMPLLAVLVAALLSALVGLLLRTSVGMAIAGLLWPLMLLGWTLVAVLLLGLLFGWPLMWSVISAEGTDSFDALSRTYNYLFSRPLYVLFCVVVASAVGILGWLLVSNFAAAVVYLAYWAAGWGSGSNVVAAIKINSPQLGLFGQIGATLIRFWVECVKLLAVGFLYSYLWTTATAVYFLLRRSVDAREMDEVFLEDSGQEVYGLPPLKTGESGIPEVADAPEGGGQEATP
jgi:hypothetical protein